MTLTSVVHKSEQTISCLLCQVIKQEELDYIREIKEENIKLKETIRYKDRELETKASETEAVSENLTAVLKFALAHQLSNARLGFFFSYKLK